WCPSPRPEPGLGPSPGWWCPWQLLPTSSMRLPRAQRRRKPGVSCNSPKELVLRCVRVVRARDLGARASGVKTTGQEWQVKADTALQVGVAQGVPHRTRALSPLQVRERRLQLLGHYLVETV